MHKMMTSDQVGKNEAALQIAMNIDNFCIIFILIFIHSILIWYSLAPTFKKMNFLFAETLFEKNQIWKKPGKKPVLLKKPVFIGFFQILVFFPIPDCRRMHKNDELE